MIPRWQVTCVAAFLALVACSPEPKGPTDEAAWPVALQDNSGAGIRIPLAKTEIEPATYSGDDAEADPGPPPISLADLTPGKNPVLTSDEAGLWMQMERAEETLKRSGNLIEDPALTAYIRDLVCKLSGPYCSDIRTYVVRVPYFNASMAPNGAMQVWSGLLLRVKNEAQLAAILSHEIAHFVRRHSFAQFRVARDDSSAFIILKVASRVVTRLAGLGPLNRLMSLVSVDNIAAYGRGQEREADIKGQQLMHLMGYDASQAADIWRRVLKEKAANNGSPWVFFASHPSTAERVETMARNAAELARSDQRGITGEAAFQRAIKPWRREFLQDDLHLRRFQRSEAMIKTLIEDGFDVAVLHFHLGELYRLRNTKNDRDAALSSYRTALKNADAPAETFRSMGLVLRREGDHAAARDAFRRYIDRKPDADDRPMIETMIEATIETTTGSGR